MQDEIEDGKAGPQGLGWTGRILPALALLSAEIDTRAESHLAIRGSDSWNL